MIPIITVIIITLSLILYLIIRRRPISLSLPKRTKQVTKKPLIKIPLKTTDIEKKETVEMITQTKSLLQHIQEDVEVYMEKLQEIENQFSEPKTKEEKKIEIQKEKPTKIKDINEIEAKIDKLLSESENKENT